MSTPEYITCRELIAFIADFREGSLAPEVAHEVERHLAVCPSCVEYLAGYADTVELLELAREDGPAPTDMPAALVDAILAARRRG